MAHGAILAPMATADPDGPPAHDPDPAPGNDPSPGHPLRERIVEAAYEAERQTGRREETEAQVRRNVIFRLLRMGGGFLLIGVGISLLVLPGPGWVMIVLGLSLLPFAWAERTLRAIRRRVPGIPDDGAIPVRTWIILGVVMVGAMAVALIFGDVVGRWFSGVWEDIWS